MSLESERREARPDPGLGLAVTQPGSADPCGSRARRPKKTKERVYPRLETRRGSPDWQFWTSTLIYGVFFIFLSTYVWYFLLEIVHAVEGYFISSGLLKRYEALNLGKLRYLAVVVGTRK
jgi:hypothetical protein